MQTFDCKVRIGGSVLNEVRREGITAAEMLVLRAMHGDDAVLELSRAGDNPDLAVDGEYERLSHVYNAKIVREVFGVPFSARLPEDLPNSLVGEPEDVKISRRGPRRGPRPAPSGEDVIGAIAGGAGDGLSAAAQ